MAVFHTELIQKIYKALLILECLTTLFMMIYDSGKSWISQNSTSWYPWTVAVKQSKTREDKR